MHLFDKRNNCQQNKKQSVMKENKYLKERLQEYKLKSQERNTQQYKMGQRHNSNYAEPPDAFDNEPATFNNSCNY